MPDGAPPRIARTRRVGGDGDVEVFVADEQHDHPVDVARWATLAESVLTAEGVTGDAELSVLFVDEAAIADLNQRFMGHDGPTDVLAFPIDDDVVELGRAPDASASGPDRPPLDPNDAPLLLGDVVICPSVAARQASEHAGTVDDELALLVVHGVLHVLGHDHADEEERTVMRARELELLQAHHWRGPVPAGFRQEQPE